MAALYIYYVVYSETVLFIDVVVCPQTSLEALDGDSKKLPLVLLVTLPAGAPGHLGPQRRRHGRRRGAGREGSGDRERLPRGWNPCRVRAFQVSELYRRCLFHWC